MKPVGLLLIFYRPFPYLINQLINCAKQKSSTEIRNNLVMVVFIGKLKINYHEYGDFFVVFSLFFVLLFNL